MTNTTKFGSWVRRFFLEHLVSERNLARNTQRSYQGAQTNRYTRHRSCQR